MLKRACMCPLPLLFLSRDSAWRGLRVVHFSRKSGRFVPSAGIGLMVVRTQGFVRSAVGKCE